MFSYRLNGEKKTKNMSRKIQKECTMLIRPRKQANGEGGGGGGEKEIYTD